MIGKGFAEVKSFGFIELNISFSILIESVNGPDIVVYDESVFGFISHFVIAKKIINRPLIYFSHIFLI